MDLRLGQTRRDLELRRLSWCWASRTTNPGTNSLSRHKDPNRSTNHRPGKTISTLYLIRSATHRIHQAFRPNTPLHWLDQANEAESQSNLPETRQNTDPTSKTKLPKKLVARLTPNTRNFQKLEIQFNCRPTKCETWSKWREKRQRFCGCCCTRTNICGLRNRN